MAVLQVMVNGSTKSLDARPRRSEGSFVHVVRRLIVSEVDDSLRVRKTGNYFLSPALVLSAELAVHLSQRLPPLRLCLGLEQVREALHGRQIHLSVRMRAPGEVARRRRAQPKRLLKALKSGERPRHDGRAAMNVELDNVLAREGRGAGDGEHHGSIDELPSGRMPKSADRSMAWFGHLGAFKHNFFQRSDGLWSC
jgi:hypothetical protein